MGEAAATVLYAEHFDMDELQRVLKKLKNGKAPGKDRVINEMIKYAGEEFHELLLELYNRCLDMEAIPNEWKVGKVTAIFKNKGDPAAWSQQRYLVMTSAFCKVLEAMLDHRMRCHFERKSFPGHWEEAQWGFRIGRGCAPQVYLLRRYVRQRMAKKQPTYVAFIDLWKAFPSTNRAALLVQLHGAGVRGSLWPRYFIGNSRGSLHRIDLSW